MEGGDSVADDTAYTRRLSIQESRVSYLEIR